MLLPWNKRTHAHPHCKQEHLTRTQGVLGLLQKEVFLLKEELNLRGSAEGAFFQQCSVSFLSLCVCTCARVIRTLSTLPSL